MIDPGLEAPLQRTVKQDSLWPVRLVMVSSALLAIIAPWPLDLPGAWFIGGPRAAALFAAVTIGMAGVFLARSPQAPLSRWWPIVIGWLALTTVLGGGSYVGAIADVSWQMGLGAWLLVFGAGMIGVEAGRHGPVARRLVVALAIGILGIGVHGILRRLGIGPAAPFVAAGALPPELVWAERTAITTYLAVAIPFGAAVARSLVAGEGIDGVVPAQGAHESRWLEVVMVVGLVVLVVAGASVAALAAVGAAALVQFLRARVLPAGGRGKVLPAVLVAGSIALGAAVIALSGDVVARWSAGLDEVVASPVIGHGVDAVGTGNVVLDVAVIAGLPAVAGLATLLALLAMRLWTLAGDAFGRGVLGAFVGWCTCALVLPVPPAMTALAFLLVGAVLGREDQRQRHLRRVQGGRRSAPGLEAVDAFALALTTAVVGSIMVVLSLGILD